MIFCSYASIFITNYSRGVIAMSTKELDALGIDFRKNNQKSLRLKELEERAARCCCRYCGKPLTLRKITYAAYDEAKIEIFCEHCNRIEAGAEPEIYKLAAYYIDDLQYDHYPNLDNSERKRRMNIALVCDILTWGFKNSGLLNKNGFNFPITLEEDVMNDAFSISDAYFNSLENE